MTGRRKVECTLVIIPTYHSHLVKTWDWHSWPLCSPAGVGGAGPCSGRETTTPWAATAPAGSIAAGNIRWDQNGGGRWWAELLLALGVWQDEQWSCPVVWQGGGAQVEPGPGLRPRDGVAHTAAQGPVGGDSPAGPAPQHLTPLPGHHQGRRASQREPGQSLQPLPRGQDRDRLLWELRRGSSTSPHRCSEGGEQKETTAGKEDLLGLDNKYKTPLQPTDQNLTASTRYFHYRAELSDKTAGRSAIECTARQSVDDDIIYSVTSQQQINVVFPPQPVTVDDVVARVNQSVRIDLTIEAFPLTTVKNLVWNIIDGNNSLQVNLTKYDVLNPRVSLT